MTSSLDQEKSETVYMISADATLTVIELAEKTYQPIEFIHELMAHGYIEPLPASDHGQHPQFSLVMLRRAQRVINLQRDLALNLAGAILAADLYEEIQMLRDEIANLKSWHAR